jgi:disulfide bond formation protein DsbB
MHNIKIDTYLKIIFLISLISIISAYFIEYILGYQPCNLCLIERIPYALSIILIILNYFFNQNKQFVILLLILVFAFSLLISFYHFGIEQGFFEESTVCGIKDANNIISKEELLKQLQLKTISCKDVAFRIFGLSLSTFNIVISLVIFILLIKIFKDYEKIKS